MTKHLLRDLDRLKRDILEIGSLVENAIHDATGALLERRAAAARAVIDGDDEIDRREVALEEECLKTLALHQPVAADLRFIVTMLKVNNDLERMGDLAANIAGRALYLSDHPPLPGPRDVPEMVRRVRAMVSTSLTALVERDTSRAREVLAADDAVDSLHRQMFDELRVTMEADPSHIERATHLLSATRNLERIADQATNIAEDVLFLVDGEIIRHRPPGGNRPR